MSSGEESEPCVDADMAVGEVLLPCSCDVVAVGGALEPCGSTAVGAIGSLKLFNDQTNNRYDQKNNICIRIGESSKYATLAMKATILDKSDIILTSWIDM